MGSARLLINGKEIMTFSQLPKEFRNTEREIKKALIQFGTMHDFDFDNDSISYELDLGENFYAVFYKNKILKN